METRMHAREEQPLRLSMSVGCLCQSVVDVSLLGLSLQLYIGHPSLQLYKERIEAVRQQERGARALSRRIITIPGGQAERIVDASACGAGVLVATCPDHQVLALLPSQSQSIPQ